MLPILNPDKIELILMSITCNYASNFCYHFWIFLFYEKWSRIP